jgi:hypothetical protein
MTHTHTQKVQQQPQLNLCPAGGPHDFQPLALKNQTTDRKGSLGAGFSGIFAGAKGKSKDDRGERGVLYCTKCGDTKTV